MAITRKKNGLVELIRFLCAVWVAYFHGFFPVHSDKFNGVTLPVDIFFIICGFFFLNSIEKYREKPYWEGVRFIVWGRIKKIIVPLIIAASSILLCNILFPLDLGFNWPLSFLWFFAAQFVYLSLYYLLLKKVKKQSVFNVVCLIIICISLSASSFLTKPIDIPVRGPAMIAIGMLLSQIPSINIKAKTAKASKVFNIFINALGFVITLAIYIYLAYLPGGEIWKIHFLCVIVCPAVLYFAVSLPVYSKFFNLLGELSIFIYLGQCPILFHHYLVSQDSKDQFPILCVCVVVLFVLNRIINAKRASKKASVAGV